MMFTLTRTLFAAMLAFSLPAISFAANPEIGSVDTAFKLVGPNHKIVVEVFDDPKVKGAACYVSRAKTGGALAIVGMATDVSEASVACRQTGKISFTGPLPVQEEVFSQSASILFKRMRVVRMIDPTRNVLVYMVYSDKIIDGSPQNSVTAIAVPIETPIPVKK